MTALSIIYQADVPNRTVRSPVRPPLQPGHWFSFPTLAWEDRVSLATSVQFKIGIPILHFIFVASGALCVPCVKESGLQVLHTRKLELAKWFSNEIYNSGRSSSGPM